MILQRSAKFDEAKLTIRVEVAGDEEAILIRTSDIRVMQNEITGNTYVEVYIEADASAPEAG